MTANLIEMLTYKRPHGSQTEREFIRRWIAPTGARIDGFGNYLLRIGDAPILWSSHTDTVHGSEGRQRLRVRHGRVMLRHKTDGCLGADDTTGCWLMVEMARAGVPGLYIWHAGEERGCMGSRYIAAHQRAKLAGIKMAIAFDRKGYRDIITHQRGRRCCSEAFAASLARALNLNFRADPSGVYTDTDSYADFIPECTNLSVGYLHQHGAKETQDVAFAYKLRAALLRADFTKLVVERDPARQQSSWEQAWLKDLEIPRRGTQHEYCSLCGERFKVNDLKYFEGAGVCAPCYDSLTGVGDWTPRNHAEADLFLPTSENPYDNA